MDRHSLVAAHEEYGTSHRSRVTHVSSKKRKPCPPVTPPPSLESRLLGTLMFLSIPCSVNPPHVRGGGVLLPLASPCSSELQVPGPLLLGCAWKQGKQSPAPVTPQSYLRLPGTPPRHPCHLCRFQLLSEDWPVPARPPHTGPFSVAWLWQLTGQCPLAQAHRTVRKPWLVPTSRHMCVVLGSSSTHVKWPSGKSQE